MIQFFNTILFYPVFNLLVLIYNTVAFQDFGLAVVILTIGVRLVLSPLSIRAIRSQREMSAIQPQIKELQERHKGNREELGRATMALYKEHKVNPFGGCLPLLVQIPVLLALYSAFSAAFNPASFANIYSFITNPGTINPLTLGFIDLTKTSPILAILAGGLQFIQSWQSQKLTPASNQQMAGMNKQLLYFFPVIVIIISWKLQTGIVLYWVATTLFSIVELIYISKKYHVRS